jgi:2-haloacid dehalogenase
MATKTRPIVVAFDVIETLFDLAALEPRLAAVGVDGGLVPLWFSRLLRDAFALDATGVFKPFPDVAGGTLEVLLAEHGVEPTREKVQEVLSGFSELPPHPDVVPAFQLLRDAGVRIVTLSNGTTKSTKKLLERAAIDQMVEHVITIEDVKHWKPRAEVYLHAAGVCGVKPQQFALVATHAWDVQGASRAGLMTGWVARKENRYLGVTDPPDVRGRSLVEVVEQLLDLKDETD